MNSRAAPIRRTDVQSVVRLEVLSLIVCCRVRYLGGGAEREYPQGEREVPDGAAARTLHSYRENTCRHLHL